MTSMYESFITSSFVCFHIQNIHCAHLLLGTWVTHASLSSFIPSNMPLGVSRVIPTGRYLASFVYYREYFFFEISAFLNAVFGITEYHGTV